MPRGHVKNTTVRALKHGRVDTHIGMGSVVCEACSSKLVFAAGERPEVCGMCGTTIPEPWLVSMKQLKKRRKTARSTDGYLAGWLKRSKEHKVNPEAGQGVGPGEQPGRDKQYKGPD